MNKITIQKMFGMSPTLIIFQIVISPPAAANTKAFGGVAIGNKNAYELVTVAGSVKYKGCRLRLSDCAK